MPTSLKEVNVIKCPELRSNIEEYCKYEFREDAIKYIEEMLEDYSGNEQLLKRNFMERLAFGTAGLRARMEVAGTNVMNVLTVLQTSQGVAEYLLKRENGVSERPIFVGYDARHNSRLFAEYTATAFATKGFKVHLFNEVTATPFTPFAIKKHNGLFGIQVTASHNPKADNGYKVYNSNGAQIIPPVDGDIAAMILKNLMPWEGVLKLRKADGSLTMHPNIVTDSLRKIENEYMADIGETVLEKKCADSEVKIVYTAMHGVGSEAVHKFVKQAGFNMKNFHVVPEQDKPDPEFTTVVFPNPEEEGALDLAMATADKIGAPVIFANDPDADRFAMCEKGKDGKWHRFHGNEIGTLIGYICMEIAKKKGIPYEKQLFVASTVSSKNLKKIVESKGCKFVDTMTGFKWIMNEGIDLENKEGLTFILGYEEALGYAVTMKCPDKDGVSASGIMAQQVCSLYSQGKSLLGLLQELREEYGYFVTNNGYKKCYQPKLIDEMFVSWRNEGNYPTMLGPKKILRIRDVTTGLDTGAPDKKCQWDRISAQMITLYLEDDIVVTLRTSGTEPKIKWYAECCSNSPELAKGELEKVVNAIVKDIMKPEKYPIE